MNQLREAARAVDTASVRAAAAGLAHRGVEAGHAAQRIGVVDAWRGPGAQAAATARREVTRRGRTLGDALTDAAGVLRRCADELDHVAQLRATSMALVREDTQAQQAAERARAILRARSAATTGPPLPPYTWDAGTALLVAASRYSAEADELEAAAVRRSVAALADLRPAQRRSGSGHVAGFGRGAWNAVLDTAALVQLASPASAVADPAGWWSDARGFTDGLALLARHPREGLSAALGLDQLKAGAYGEWLGGLAAGAVMPPSRGARVLGAGRLVDAGGPVRLRPGVVAPAGFPTRIADLEPDRRVHILDGDERGGGHRSGVGNPRKSEFPPGWSDDDIIATVMEVAMRPDRVEPQSGGRFRVFGQADGVLVKVVLEADGRVVTAHPLEGPGVVRNPRKGAE